MVAVATQRLLRHAGLEVTHSSNVEDAIVSLQAGGNEGIPGPHVVLSDVTLRGELSGEDLLRVIREDLDWDRATLPVVIMTGDDDRDNQARLLRAGANDLVVKPVDGGLLIKKLRFQLHLAEKFRRRLGGKTKLIQNVSDFRRIFPRECPPDRPREPLAHLALKANEC